MNASFKTGLAAGTLAGAATVTSGALLVPLGVIPKPPPTEFVQETVGGSQAGATAAGLPLFAAGGGVWGGFFAALVEDPTPLKGAVFGLLPTLYQGTVVARMMGKPMFFGGDLVQNGLTLAANCLVWGPITGWYCRRRATD